MKYQYIPYRGEPRIADTLHEAVNRSVFTAVWNGQNYCISVGAHTLGIVQLYEPYYGPWKLTGIALDGQPFIHYTEAACEAGAKALCQDAIHPTRIDSVSKVKLAYCSACDGCGWIEGGLTLRTACKPCSGRGVLEC